MSCGDAAVSVFRSIFDSRMKEIMTVSPSTGLLHEMKEMSKREKSGIDRGVTRHLSRKKNLCVCWRVQRGGYCLGEEYFLLGGSWFSSLLSNVGNTIPNRFFSGIPFWMWWCLSLPKPSMLSRKVQIGLLLCVHFKGI